MNPKIQTFLILFISILLCNITPATAIQANTTNPDYTDLREQIINTFWSVFDEGNNTELTSEQKNYLEQKDPQIKNKAEAILDNLQYCLNYLYGEYDEYQLKEENNKRFNQRKLLEISTDTSSYEKAKKDAKNVAKYLNELKEITNQNETIKTVECDYDQLLDECTRNASYKDHVIVQIKAPKADIRYMKLISINNNTIELKSGKTLLKGKNVFTQDYIYKNDGDKFDIIIVPPDSDTDSLLEEIWLYQDESLSQKESLVENINKIAYVFLGTAGLGIIIAGTYKICDTCTSPTTITRHIVKRIIEDETTALMQHEHRDLTRDCEKTITETSSNSRCSKCKISTAIIVIGTFILAGSMALVFYCSYLKTAYEKEHTRLKEFKP